MKDLTSIQTQIDLVQQVVLCYTDFNKSPAETVTYLQSIGFLPRTSDAANVCASDVCYQANIPVSHLIN